MGELFRLEADLEIDRWVKTQNGQAFADSVGVKEPPMSLEESVEGVLGQVRRFPPAISFVVGKFLI